jgi:Tripartite tricarboxylate transporter TctB family
MRLQKGGWRITVDLPHLAFVTGLAGYCTWYFHDVWSNANDSTDLLLIGPLFIAVVILYLFIAVGTINVERAEGGRATAGPAREALSRFARIRIFGSMFFFTAYVFSISYIGFDVATFLYVLCALLLLGERRPIVLVALPLVFCALAIYLFRTILQMPMPLTFGSAQ